MASFEKQRRVLAELGVSIVAGSVDSEEKTTEVAAELGFPVAWGMTREMGELVGAWWEEDREFIQPSEFFITGSGEVLASTYSSSPVGRMDPEDAVTLARFIIGKRSG